MQNFLVVAFLLFAISFFLYCLKLGGFFSRSLSMLYTIFVCKTVTNGFMSYTVQTYRLRPLQLRYVMQTEANHPHSLPIKMVKKKIHSKRFSPSVPCLRIQAPEGIPLIHYNLYLFYIIYNLMTTKNRIQQHFKLSDS